MPTFHYRQFGIGIVLLLGRDNLRDKGKEPRRLDAVAMAMEETGKKHKIRSLTPSKPPSVLSHPSPKREEKITSKG